MISALDFLCVMDLMSVAIGLDELDKAPVEVIVVFKNVPYHLHHHQFGHLVSQSVHNHVIGQFHDILVDVDELIKQLLVCDLKMFKSILPCPSF